MNLTNLAPYQVAVLAAIATLVSAVIAATASITTSWTNGRMAMRLDREKAWREYRLARVTTLMNTLDTLRDTYGHWPVSEQDPPLTVDAVVNTMKYPLGWADVRLTAARDIYIAAIKDYEAAPSPFVAGVIAARASLYRAELERVAFCGPGFLRYSLGMGLFRRFHYSLARRRMTKMTTSVPVDKSPDTHNLAGV